MGAYEKCLVPSQIFGLAYHNSPLGIVFKALSEGLVICGYYIAFLRQIDQCVVPPLPMSGHDFHPVRGQCVQCNPRRHPIFSPLNGQGLEFLLDLNGDNQQGIPHQSFQLIKDINLEPGHIQQEIRIQGHLHKSGFRTNRIASQGYASLLFI